MVSNKFLHSSKKKNFISIFFNVILNINSPKILPTFTSVSIKYCQTYLWLSKGTKLRLQLRPINYSASTAFRFNWNPLRQTAATSTKIFFSIKTITNLLLYSLNLTNYFLTVCLCFNFNWLYSTSNSYPNFHKWLSAVYFLRSNASSGLLLA